MGETSKAATLPAAAAAAAAFVAPSPPPHAPSTTSFRCSDGRDSANNSAATV